MIVPRDPGYQETKRILLGQERMLETREELAKWIEATYGAKVLNVLYFSKSQPFGPQIPVRNRLHVVVPRRCDADALESELAKDDSRAVVTRFRELVERRQLQGYDLENLIALGVAFMPVAFVEAYWRVSDDEAKEVQRRVAEPELWTAELGWFSFDFLFFTDEQVRRHDTPETRAKYAAACFEVLRRHDETGLLTAEDIEIALDSKETVDKYFNGSLAAFAYRK